MSAAPKLALSPRSRVLHVHAPPQLEHDGKRWWLRCIIELSVRQDPGWSTAWTEHWWRSSRKCGLLHTHPRTDLTVALSSMILSQLLAHSLYTIPLMSHSQLHCVGIYLCCLSRARLMCFRHQHSVLPRSFPAALSRRLSPVTHMFGHRMFGMATIAMSCDCECTSGQVALSRTDCTHRCDRSAHDHSPLSGRSLANLVDD